MSFILSLAASLLGWGKIALAWIAKLPWYVLALAGCAAAILWQHHAEVRKDARIAALSATLDQVKVAQAQAQKAAQAAHDAQEAAYRAKAQDADNAYQTQLAAAQSATDRYIAAHRVRSDVAGPTGGTVASAAGDSAPRVDGPGIAADMVAVSAADVGVCTVNTQRLQAARDWAMGLNK